MYLAEFKGRGEPEVPCSSTVLAVPAPSFMSVFIKDIYWPEVRFHVMTLSVFSVRVMLAA